jgi:hypothetical protein
MKILVLLLNHRRFAVCIVSGSLLEVGGFRFSLVFLVRYYDGLEQGF